MAETLGEISSELRERTRFITPSIRNLDTGDVYSVAELESKVPKGVDPQFLSKNKKRVDLGDLFCMPVVAFIPRHWHPNVITIINHVFNWILLGIAFCTPLLPGHWRIGGFMMCAVVNFFCMMLDCLDGMHARKTGQCSKLGELLDHFLDAVHVPLVVGGICYSLRHPPLAVAILVNLNSYIYNIQLIVYHYKRVFIQVVGVEGQILTSVFYIVVASICNLDEVYMLWFSRCICVAACFISAKVVYDFILRCDVVMFRKFIDFVMMNVLVSLIYLFGGMTTFSYVILSAAFSFRVTGNYVMYSIMQRPYKGYDFRLNLWIVIMLWAFFLVRPLPVTDFFYPLLPYLSKYMSLSIFDGQTVQDVLPYACTIHLAFRAVYTLQKNYYCIKHLK